MHSHVSSDGTHGRLFFSAAVVAVALAVLAQAAAAENVHFLNPSKGEHVKALADLSAKAKAAPAAQTLADLGWVRMLYFADMEGASGHFAKALELDPLAKDALVGLALANYGRAMPDALAECVRTIIERFPDSPEAELLVKEVEFFSEGRELTRKERLAWFEKTLAAAKNPALATEIRADWARELMADEEFDRAFALWLENGNVPCWYVLGMMGAEGPCWFDEPLPPEEKIELDRKYPSGIEEISWRPVRFAKYDLYNPAGMTGAIRGNGAVSYALVYIKAQKKTEVSLRTLSGGSFKAWLNGAQIATIDRFREYLPAETAVGATLAEGWNSLLVKVVSGGSRYGYYGRGSGGPMGSGGMRITKPDGTPAEGLEFSCDFTAANAPQTPARGFEAECGKPDPGAIERLEKACAADGRTFGDRLFLALACERAGLEEKSFKEFERLFDAHQGFAFANHMMARAYYNNSHYPWDLKRIKNRAMNEEARKLDPGFLPAVLAVADEKMDKNPESALDEVRELADRRKDSIRIWTKLSEIFRNLRWEAEYLSVMMEIGTRWPDRPETISMWENWYGERGNLLKALEYAEKGLAAAGIKSRARLSQYWERLGRYDLVVPELEKQISRKAEDFYSRRELAGICMQTGEHQKALRLLSEIRDGNPDDKSVLAEIAHVHALMGNEDKAREVMAEILAQPARYGVYDNDIRRCLHFAGCGSYEDWTSPWNVSAEKIIEESAGMLKDYADVSSVVLFEQHVVRFHGEDLKAAESTIEQIVKIMNKAGGEKYGRLYSDGRMLEAHVFTPDGRLLEPDPVQEGWNMALPKLDKDSVIHMKYISDVRVQAPSEGVRQIAHGPQIRRNDEAVLRFRYVVIMPAESKYLLRARNLDMQPEERIEGDEKVLIWDLSNVKDVVDEAYSPADWEVLPQIVFYMGEPIVDRVERQLKSQVMDAKVPAMIQDEAARLTAGIGKPVEKIRRIYSFCVSEIKQAWTRDPCQTLFKKEGNAADLFEALVRGAGMPIYQVRFCQRQQAGVDWDFQALAGMQQGIYCLPVPGEGDIWVAPGRHVPFGCLPDSAYGAPAVVLAREGCRFLEIPGRPFEERVPAVSASVAMKPDGSAEVSGEISLPGMEAASYRVMLEKYVTQAQMKMFVSMFLNQIFRGITVESFEIDDFDMDKPVMKGKFKGTLAMFGTLAPGKLSFKPVMRTLGLSRVYARETTRKFPLRIGPGFMRGGNLQLSTLRSVDSFTFAIPEGGTVKKPRSIILVGEFGEYVLTFTLEGNMLRAERRFTMYSKDIPADRYPAFAKFLKLIDQWEMESVDVAMAGGK